MTIIEALKSGKIPRIEVGDRWLVFDTSNIEIYNNRFIVRQDVRHTTGMALGKIVCITTDEDEAVKWLTGEECTHEHVIDGYPGGNIVTVKCLDCGKTWKVELPQ